MTQSLLRNHEVDDLVARYGHVIVDECHHVPARQFERVLSEVKARYVTGLTARPKRRDGQHPILEIQLGPARYVIDTRSKSSAWTFRHRLVVRETDFELPDASAEQAIQCPYRSLAGDGRRNDPILNDVISALEEGRLPIVLSERKDHLDFLSARLRGLTPYLSVLRRGVSAKKRSEELDVLASVPKSAERVVLATGRYFGEGFDDARLDTLLLTMPVAWRGTVVQYTGRLHRAYPGQSELRIYDYVDARVPVLVRVFQKRFAGYRSMGYAPDGTLSAGC